MSEHNVPAWVGPAIPIGGGARVVLNPGTGPVPEATHDNAVACLNRFVADIGLDIAVTDCDLETTGRFRFALRQGERHCIVEMPGLPVEQVRYMRLPGQDPWDYPRLYVDGGSWLWCFGLGIARSALMRGKDLDEVAGA